MMSARAWEDIDVGDVIGPVAFPLSIYRMVLSASAVRDFAAIHHNTRLAQKTGAPDMYASMLFLQGMWERTVREYMGPAGRMLSMTGFRMRSFNCVGETVVVSGEVVRKWRAGPHGRADLRIWSTNGERISVGPGIIAIELPCRTLAAWTAGR